MEKVCGHEGCARPRRRYGYCDSHSSQFKKHGTTWDIGAVHPGDCNWADCSNVSENHNLNRCTEHRGRCAVTDGTNWCPQSTFLGKDKSIAADICPMHNERLRATGSYGPVGRYRKEYESRDIFNDGRRITPDGYAMVRVRNAKGRQVFRSEHRIVMEGYLGRPLTTYETVHHRNLNRSDNRIENLELWASRHPRGARIPDLIEYANQILEEYGDYIEPPVA